MQHPSHLYIRTTVTAVITANKPTAIALQQIHQSVTHLPKHPTAQMRATTYIKFLTPNFSTTDALLSTTTTSSTLGTSKALNSGTLT